MNNHVCMLFALFLPLLTYINCWSSMYLLISVGVMKVWAIPLLQRIIDCGWTNHSPELRHVT